MVSRFEEIGTKERLALEELREKLKERFSDQVLTVIHFGSRARGNSAKDSDVDVLVVLKQRTTSLTRAVWRLASDISLQHDLDLSVKVYGVEEFSLIKRLETGFYKNVAKEGIDVWMTYEKESRERSDYDEFFTATGEDAKDMLEEAERFVKRIEKYLKSSGVRLD